MTASQILESILQQDDASLLTTLPTEPRQACSCCGSVSVVKRVHSAVSGLYHCPVCKGNKPVNAVTYYVKNKTTDPSVALNRHRTFWQRIYYEQLNRESNPATFRSSNPYSQ